MNRKNSSIAPAATRRSRQKKPRASGFSPSPIQLRFVYYYMTFPYLRGRPESKASSGPGSLPHYPTIKDVCRVTGVSRASVYRWFKNPDFNAWWHTQYSATLALLAPRFTHALLDSAEFGHPLALKVFFHIYPPFHPNQVHSGQFPHFPDADDDSPVEPEESDQPQLNENQPHSHLSIITDRDTVNPDKPIPSEKS